MRNKKIMTILILILFCSYSYGSSNYYHDVENHWGQEYIYWVSNKIQGLKGYTDGTFRPNEYVTRGEFIDLLNGILQKHKIYHDNVIKEKNMPYLDVDWNQREYNSIIALINYIDDYSNIDIRFSEIFPGDNLYTNEKITRYEAALLARALTTPPLMTNYPTIYKDVDTNMSFYPEISELVQNNIIKGYKDNTLRLHNSITRAEASVLGKKVYDDLKYLLSNQITITSFTGKANTIDLPLFQPKNKNSSQSALDEKFINAIASLEYLSFIGFIPYNEKHLYDLNPIDTLWDLKNKNYYNVIGVNYYLLAWDKDLVSERKSELILETINHYHAIDSNSINDFYLFLNAGKQYIPEKEFIEIVEGVFYSTDNVEEKLHMGESLVEFYLQENRIDESLLVYEKLMEIEKDVIVSATIAKNYAYLISKEDSYERTVSMVNGFWNKLRNHEEYRMYKEEVDYIFTAFLKQLKIRNRML